MHESAEYQSVKFDDKLHQKFANQYYVAAKNKVIIKKFYDRKAKPSLKGK